MAPKHFKPNHLELRYQTYFAVLVVPKDVRHIVGKSKFFETTGTGDLKIAQSLANLKVIKWKAEIATARTNTSDPIINSALELNRMLKTSPTHLVKEVIEDEASRIAYQIGEYASSTFSVIAKGIRKPLTTFIDEWVKNEKKRGLANKTISQMQSDVGILVEFLPTSNLLELEHTNTWIKHITKTGNLSPASVTRIIGSCRNFYKHLKLIGEVPEDAKEPFIVPIESKLSKKRNSKAQNKSESWLPFSTNEVESIYQHAILYQDWVLGQLILIGAYTGARIEEICSLRKEHVNLKNSSLNITDTKTEAGERQIPIHKTLLPIIEELMTCEDEYLLAKLTKSKFDDRSNAIGKRFGRLKTKLGYSRRYVFHSIRKTFTTQLENAGVNITADIIGHEKPRMTYGLYSGGTNLDVKRKAVAKIFYNFKNPTLSE
jgi:integrase